MQGTSRSELADELDRCARLCEDTGERYAREQPHLVSSILLAAAAMDTALAVVDDDEGRARETALMITATLTQDALDAIEAHGLDEPLLRCTEALRRVLDLCDT